MTTISKTVFEFTVLHRTGEEPADAHDAVMQAHDGEIMGQQTFNETTEVTDEMVPAELVAIGNDGHYFDDDLED